jgi:hypothetical protein
MLSLAGYHSDQANAESWESHQNVR